VSKANVSRTALGAASKASVSRTALGAVSKASVSRTALGAASKASVSRTALGAASKASVSRTACFVQSNFLEHKKQSCKGFFSFAKIVKLNAYFSTLNQDIRKPQ